MDMRTAPDTPQDGGVLVPMPPIEPGPAPREEAIAETNDTNHNEQDAVEQDAVTAGPEPPAAALIPPELTVRHLALLKLLARADLIANTDNTHPIGDRVNPDGLPVSDLVKESEDQGFSLQYEHAAIFWRPTDQAEARVVYNATLDKWNSNLWIGHPVSDLETCCGGFYTRFQNNGARIYVDENLSNPRLIYGSIVHKWLALGADASFLGLPGTDELGTPDGIGRFNHFKGGSIYWTAELGAWSVRGAIREKWASRGWETGHLGYPVTDELPTPDGRGRFNHFQGGSIYWHPDVGAWSIFGAIKAKWVSLGWERGFLGYPTTDELTTPDGRGRFTHFQHGSIYWLPEVGAWSIHGAIKEKWASLRWEAGQLGYPVTDELTTPDGVGRYNHFQGGSIYWTPTLGAWSVYGAIKDKWAEIGWETSRLGYPRTDEQPTGKYGGRYQDFERGWIYWSAVTGIATIVEGGVQITVPEHKPLYIEHTFRKGVALGGHSRVMILQDGTVKLDGNMRATGAVRYNYQIVYTVVDADNQSHSFAKQGSVGPSNRQANWHEQVHNDELQQQWRAIIAGNKQLRWGADYNADVGRVLEDLLKNLSIGITIASKVLLFIV